MLTKHRTTTMAALTVALAMTASMGDAQTRRIRTHHGPAERVSAIAALTPVGAADGWGRVTVHDLAEGDTVERAVTVHLYELAPDAAYTVTADGVDLGQIQTDADGAGWLGLRTDHAWLPPVPADLPPAGELALATVVDASMAPTLEGAFVIMGHGSSGPGDLVYQERIHLDAVTDLWQRSMARVARDVDDEQLFDTRGHGLVTGTAYEVRIDGILAGVVTADAVGQAWLSLSTEDGTLPADLQPIEDLRLVEWSDADGVVLTGSFTGDGTVGGHGDPPHGGGGDDPPHGGGHHGGGGNRP